MKQLFAAVFCITVHTACNSNSTAPAGEISIVRKEINSEVRKTVASLSIEGMTCSAGCGGKIQQDLRALKGVKTTDLDYADNRPVNTVEVEYDPSVITEQELIKCVSSIGDGQYAVKSVEVLTYKGLQSHS